MKQLWMIFSQFLILGCISFGGPAAHIGYFQNTFVSKLKWLNDSEYANLISLSQVLPGPGSSQIGFAIGLYKAGLLGGIAAFLGFTLPSFLLMYWLAMTANFDQPQTWLVGVTYGLKLLAVVVVFDAITTMYKNFCQSALAKGITVCSALFLIFVSSSLSQIFILLVSASIGMISSSSMRGDKVENEIINKNKISWLCWPLVLFSLVFALSAIDIHPWFNQLFGAFYHSGSLVFGGGHVVLPLLQTNVGDGLSQDAFVFGYAAAQGIPGPMFTIATFMGTLLNPDTPFIGATLATLAIFLPGFLLVLSLKNAWQTLLANRYFSGAAWGINAAVVGLLLAAFYNPIFTSAVTNLIDVVWVLLGIALMRIFKPHIFVLIVAYVILGMGTVYF